jgi:hypothetical protein
MDRYDWAGAHVNLKNNWGGVASGRAKESWQDRAKLAASFLRAGDTVCDLGAGSQHLKQILPESVGYVAVDCVGTLPGTHVTDFNSPAFTLPDQNFNVLAALGLLNWLDHWDRFLERLSHLAEGKFIVFTYDLWEPDGDRGSGKAHDGLDTLEGCMGAFSSYVQNLTPVLAYRRRVLFTGTLCRGASKQSFRPPVTKLYLKYLRPQEYLVLKLLKLDMMPRWLA